MDDQVSVITDLTKLLEFRKEFQVVTCACCKKILAYVNKSSGNQFCYEGECLEKTQVVPGLLANATCGSVGVPTPRLQKSDCDKTVEEKTIPRISLAAAMDFKPIPSVVQKKTKTEIEARPGVGAGDTTDSSMDFKPVPSVVQKKPTAEIEAKAGVGASDTTDSGMTSQKVGKPLTPAPVSQPLPDVPDMVNPLNAENRSTSLPVAKPRVYFDSGRYSSSLMNGANVRVSFAWGPTTYTISTEQDVEDLAKFQQILMDWAEGGKLKRFTRIPEKDEMVVAKYEDAWYRGMITAIKGDKCEVSFVDFGDSSTCHYQEIFSLARKLNEVPIFGLIVTLHDVPREPEGFALREDLEQELYESTFMLELKMGSGIQLEPGSLSMYPAVLWRPGKQSSFNMSVRDSMKDWHCGWIPPSPSEQQEIEHMKLTSIHFKETVDIVEEHITYYKGVTPGRRYIFRLDNIEYPYMKVDMPVPFIHDAFKTTMEVEICSYQNLGHIIVKPLDPTMEMARQRLSNDIEKWLGARKDKMNELRGFIPERNAVCLVQWPASFMKVSVYAERIFDDFWIQENDEDLRWDIFQDDYDKYEGKWFRAICKHSYKEQDEDNEPKLYEMFLMDIGKTTLISRDDVFPMPHRFVYDMPYSFQMSLRLDGLVQNGPEVDEKWRYLLLPAKKIKVKVFWVFDGILFVKLVAPTQAEFDDHFQKFEVQNAIAKWKKKVREQVRHRQIKKISKVKGSYQKNKDLALKEEEKQKKLKPLKKKYSAIGKAPYERIYQLSIPHPIPEEYRDRTKFEVSDDYEFRKGLTEKRIC